jgi:glycosyltransferase involved in cell wall biosynthesis
MRILWHSTSPLAKSGYGIVTKEIINRLKERGHFIRVGTKHQGLSWYKWKGFEIFEATDTLLVNQMIEEENFDYIFTLWDIWQLHSKRQYPKEKWVAYIPIDTEWISDALTGVVKNVGFPIAMSRHGERELKSRGFNPLYAPHGIDTETFKFNAEGRKNFRKELGLTEDNFVIGSVGLNYGDDRKGFVPLMRAFKVFHEKHKEARLFLHTVVNERDTLAQCVNYQKIALHLGIDKTLIFPPQLENFLGRIDPLWLAEIYSGFDVFCLATKGEGFGLPLIEAPSCGVPTITTNTTTGREFFEDKFVSWLIPTDNFDDSRWLPNGTWRLEPRPSAILGSLEKAYVSWKNSDIDKIREKNRKAAVAYDWDVVWDKFWVPIFDYLEKKLVDSNRVHKTI